jgi:ribonuclease R
MGEKKQSPSKNSKKKLRETLWSALKDQNYQPQKTQDLFKACKIAKKNHALANDCISDLIAKNMIEIKNSIIYPVIKKEDVVVSGKISMHAKGFGFVIPDDLQKHPKDIFIPKSQTLGAIDQDKVQVRIVSAGKKDKGPEGAVVAITERGREHIVGTIIDIMDGFAIAYCPILGENKCLQIHMEKPLKLKDGDRVLLQIKDWNHSIEKSSASVVKVLGNINNAAEDIEVSLYDYKIRKDFPKQAIDEAKRYPENPTKTDLKNRLDLTEVETFTIDPDTARDYDDALSLRLDENNDYHLIVHIADVTSYVSANSALDKEAYLRGNSTYFPGSCVPMLPEELSNGLCSLKENVLRLSVSVFMHFDSEGELKHYDIRRSYIKSQKRFTYKEAKLVLDGKKESIHCNTLKLMEKLALILQKKRYSRGSVDLSMPELVLKIDPKGNPTGFEIVEYDITHQLVEEFMLKANEIVAHALLARGSTAIFRIHESPGTAEIEDFASLARVFGFKVKKNPSQEDIQNLLYQAKSTPYLHALSVAFIRSMKMAVYSEENVGHFGLSLEHYCHFTSPIRRYSDLIVHRILLEGAIDAKELKKIASHCSDTERNSFKAEQSVLALKKIRFLKQMFSQSPEEIYPAMITKIKPFGVFFELKGLQIDGFIHVSDLGDEYYIYNDKKNMFTGESSGVCYITGADIHVSILDIDLLKQQVFWHLEPVERKPKRKKEKNK